MSQSLLLEPSPLDEEILVPATSQKLERFFHPIPLAEADGKTKTLNQMGFMTGDSDEFSQEFIEFSSTTEHPVLDIGAAYGFYSIEALKKGATVYANDICKEHLLLLRDRSPKERWGSLFLNNKKFPSDTNFEPNSLGAVLLCCVAHFLTKEEVEEGLKKIYKWLVPGGKFYIITMSPYHSCLASFLPIFEDRWANGNQWPGIIENMHDYIPGLKDKTPQFLHVMDDRVLKTALEKAGFNVLKVGFFDRHHPNFHTNGKNHCGASAIKQG